MAVKFLHTFLFSTVSSLVIGAIFYVLSINRSAISQAYTVTDTNLGTVFVFLLAMLIGLSLWPRILEKRTTH
ncbi:MAG: hypothetical protein E4G94_02600 [ANME-2 cluster archaeon]|nr:MAG: hypothetical protein E4G94_02600 [ANME-2 cluster archaeon]